MENYYEILAIRRDASDVQIKNAFKKLAIKFHPDRLRGNSEEEQDEAHRMMSLINEAYRTLIDAEKKQDYDIWLDARDRAGSPTPTDLPPPRPREPEWVGSTEAEKPEDVQDKERRKRDLIIGKIEDLILNRVDELNWQRVDLLGWNGAYEGGTRMRKFRVALHTYPEITDEIVQDLRDFMVNGKAGLAGLLGTTSLYVVCFHEIIDHAPIYDLFIETNRDKTGRYLALVNLRYKRIDPPQVVIKNKMMDRILACLWVGLD